MTFVSLADGLFAVPDEHADAARSIRIPVNTDPGWRPPTSDELAARLGITVAAVTIEPDNAPRVAGLAPSGWSTPNSGTTAQ